MFQAKDELHLYHHNFDILKDDFMNPCQELVSKVLVLDGSETAFGILRIFCQENHLVGLRTKANDIGELLNSNIGLGAILISEEALCDGSDSLSISMEIHKARPFLPIFLRRYDSDTLEGIPEEYKDVFTGAYCLSNLEPLKNLVQVPWYAHSAGLLGLVIAGSIGFTVPRLGLSAAFTIVVATQFLVALFLEHYGFFSESRRPINLNRLAGAGGLIVSVWLLTKP